MEIGNLPSYAGGRERRGGRRLGAQRHGLYSQMVVTPQRDLDSLFWWCFETLHICLTRSRLGCSTIFSWFASYEMTLIYFTNRSPGGLSGRQQRRHGNDMEIGNLPSYAGGRNRRGGRRLGAQRHGLYSQMVVTPQRGLDSFVWWCFETLHICLTRSRLGCLTIFSWFASYEMTLIYITNRSIHYVMSMTDIETNL
jgi:hypothetical protein